MHALLLYANRPRLSYGCLPGPYGLEILRAYARSVGVECDILNPFLSADPEAAIRDAIRGDTGLIGVSVRNVDEALGLRGMKADTPLTETALGDAVDVVQWCRRLAPDVPVLLGGAAFAHMPVPLLDHLNADAGLAGMPEVDFSRLVAEMAKGRPFQDAIRALPSAVLPGPSLRLAHSTAGLTERLPVVEREAIYFRIRPEAAVRTFTGCPLRCSHCIEHLATRRITRSPIDVVADEVEGVLERYPAVRRIVLVDSEVNLAGEDRTVALVHAIRARSTARTVPLMGYFNPHPLSARLLETLAAARFMPKLTVDHVSDRILSRNGKNFRNHHLRELVGHYVALGQKLSFSLILGQPGETRDTVDEVLRFVDTIPDSIRGPIYFGAGVRVYPGTPLDRSLAAGELDPRWMLGPPQGQGSPLDLRVYCESWDPDELFEYVHSRSGGRIQSAHGYLADLDESAKTVLQAQLEAYHLGAVAFGRDDAACLAAWQEVPADAPFLMLGQRAELLRARGKLALELGNPRPALKDFLALRDLTPSIDAGTLLDELDGQISAANRLLESELDSLSSIDIL